MMINKAHPSLKGPEEEAGIVPLVHFQTHGNISMVMVSSKFICLISIINLCILTIIMCLLKTSSYQEGAQNCKRWLKKSIGHKKKHDKEMIEDARYNFKVSVELDHLMVETTM